MTALVTGGAGFIGSALVRELVARRGERVVTLDKLTYAGDRATLAGIGEDERHVFVEGDIADHDTVLALLEQHRPASVFNLAAETHVDRSIDAPDPFMHTNVMGSYQLLKAATRYWSGLEASERERFRLIHVSTDEVFGALGSEGRFDEDSPYRPSSPYAASKAASDHFARAWFHTYGLPVIVTNCSNNYGPYQFPEKLIPLMTRKAAAGEPLPVYGDGRQIRDWLHVTDHVEALLRVREAGAPGSSYAIGGACEKTNLEVVETICRALARLRPESGIDYASLVTHVPDRPGHDFRYAIDNRRITSELGWRPRIGFEEGLQETVAWIIDNAAFYAQIAASRYDGQRIGLAAPGTDASADRSGTS